METIQLEYQQNLRNFYQLLRHLPGFVLLESSDSYRGRYDILTACPYQRIQSGAAVKDFELALHYLNEALPVADSVSELPFQGGAIGYFSYALGALLAGVDSRQQQRLSDLPLLDFGLYDWAIITDHYLKQVSLFAAHRRPETKMLIEEVLKLWRQTKEKNKPQFLWSRKFQPLISKDDYQQAFGQIHRALQKGRSYQVNYTQPFIADFEGDPWQAYERVCSRNPVPFSAFLSLDEASVLSFSPERYLLMNDRQLLASPIKGTAKRSLCPEEDHSLRRALENSLKNRAENVMIVDLMRNDLGKIARTGSVKVTALCEMQSFNSVHHLVSDIRADCLEQVGGLEAFLSCFPSGSITGAPKLEAMQIINELEPYAREVYCGSIAYFSAHGRFDSNVAIRTVMAKNERLHLAAGGGLVIDSNWQDEYQECWTKIMAIIHALD